MTQQEHTPGPWSAFTAEGEQRTHTNIVAVVPVTACVFSLPGRHKSEPDIVLACAAPDLLAALKWALPLAKTAIEDHRMERIRCGHSDIVGTYASGQAWVGIWQTEVDAIERAEAAIAKATGK